MIGQHTFRSPWIWIVAFGAVAAALVGWAAALQHRAEPVVAVIPRTCGTWLWEAEHSGVMRASSGLGVHVYWNAPMREDDVQGQINVLSHAVDQGAVGVILSPVEALPLRIPVREALAHNTPVIVVDTDLGLPASNRLAYVLNDEKTGGQMAARRVGALLKGRGAVAVLGINKQLTTTTERARSLEATLAAEFPDVHVVFRSLALPTIPQEQQVAERLLASDIHVDVIVALTEFSTRGAFFALTETDRIGKTALVGFDQNILAPIRSGEIDSVIIQNTYQLGREAVRLLAQRLHGERGEDRVLVQPLLVTRESIDSPEVTQTLDLAWFQ